MRNARMRPLAAVLGGPATRIATAGSSPRERHEEPSRTASTASAADDRLALITFVAILGAGLRTSFGDAVTSCSSPDTR